MPIEAEAAALARRGRVPMDADRTALCDAGTDTVGVMRSPAATGLRQGVSRFVAGLAALAEAYSRGHRG
jgi:hypothetical protein